MPTACEKLRYDHEFYTLSYQDIRSFNEDGGRDHFLLHGINEGRFCSAYHVLSEHYPEFAEAFDWRGLRFRSTDQQTPLQLTQSLVNGLMCGLPSPLDKQLSDMSRTPTIAKHGKIFDHLRYRFNDPGCKVLEIGSRAVCSGSMWKQYIPDCSYVGFDVMAGSNVDVVGDAHRLSDYFEAESFDLIVSFAVFEHLAMPWVVAEEIAKVLKVGGYLAIETHFSHSEHELPWHFFQFNANGLEILFNKALGFETIDKGMDNPIVGRFSSQAADYLQGQVVPNLFCHSSLIAMKVSPAGFRDGFDWRAALPAALKSTMYPPLPV